MSIANEPAFRDAEGRDFGLTKREYFAAKAMGGAVGWPITMRVFAEVGTPSRSPRRRPDRRAEERSGMTEEVLERCAASVEILGLLTGTSPGDIVDELIGHCFSEEEAGQLQELLKEEN